MKATLNQIFAFTLLLVILGIITWLCIMAYNHVSTPSFVMFIVGYITALLSLAGNYLFGSTKSSQDKDAATATTTNNLITQLANSTPVAPPIGEPIKTEPIQP